VRQNPRVDFASMGLALAGVSDGQPALSGAGDR